MAKLFYPPTENALQKSLDGDLSSGVTASLTLNNTTNIQNKPGVVVIDRIDSNGELKDAADREFVTFTGTSGSTLTGLTRGVGGSTDQDHSTGAIVEFVPDVVYHQSIIDSLATLVNPDDISQINTDIVTKTGTQTLTNKTLTSPIINNSISGSAFLDEDTMSSNSATKVASQQSIKAYVDNLTTQTSVASDATPNPTGGSKYNEYYLTALAAAAEFAAPSGTPANGNILRIRIKDNGTARALTWNSIYLGISGTLPSTTTASKYMYIGFIYSSADSKWHMVAQVEES